MVYHEVMSDTFVAWDSFFIWQANIYKALHRQEAVANRMAVTKEPGWLSVRSANVCLLITSIHWYCLVKKVVLCHNYAKNLNETNTIVLMFISALDQNKYYHSGTITPEVSLFGYVIYSSVDADC